MLISLWLKMYYEKKKSFKAQRTILSKDKKLEMFLILLFLKSFPLYHSILPVVSGDNVFESGIFSTALNKIVLIMWNCWDHMIAVKN